MLIPAPGWVPYRLKRHWDHALVVSALRGLHRTVPVAAVSPADAVAEVHMLLCRRDVEIGVLALKSLLRYRDLGLAVSISEDGSVTAAQRRWIDAHVPGCAWLPRVSDAPAIAAALDTRPRLLALYRGSYQPLRKLIHPLLLARCPRVVVLDPDTAFWRRPDELAVWARSTDAPALFLHDDQDESVQVPAEVREAFAELRGRVAPHGRPWAMPYVFFNSGLLAYRRTQCDLDVAERYLEWLAEAPAKYTTGKPGLWFGTWTPEQSMYQLMFATMDPAAQPLGESYRIGHRRAATFNHFLWLQLVLPASLRQLRELVQSLPSA